jgi:hypothetical protein
MSADPLDSGSGRSAPETDDSESIADVFSRFTLDSHRRTRRHAHTSHREDRRRKHAPPERNPHRGTSWPAGDADQSTQGNAGSEGSHRAEGDEPATYIRPYSWTGGRTKSNYQLELETLVSTSEMGQNYRLERGEQQSVADLCKHPRSVAEVGALLSVPLGVAKVLLGDMADLGLITVHHTITKNGSTSHLLLMERVLSGLRRL